MKVWLYCTCTCLQYSNGSDSRLVAANTSKWLRCFPCSLSNLCHHVIIYIMPCHVMSCHDMPRAALSPLSSLLSPLSSDVNTKGQRRFSICSSISIRVRAENARTVQFVLHPTVRVLREQHSSISAFDNATALYLT